MIFTKILMPLLFVFGVGANLSALYMLKKTVEKDPAAHCQSHFSPLGSLRHHLPFSARSDELGTADGKNHFPISVQVS